MAAKGMALTKVARNELMAKQIATTTLVRPVRPPTPIPEALSTKVVVLEVPKIDPTEVAMASANNCSRAYFDGNLFCYSNRGHDLYEAKKTSENF